MFPSFLLILTFALQVFCDLSCGPCKYHNTTSNKTATDCRGLPTVTLCKYNSVPLNLNPDTATLLLDQQRIEILKNNVFVDANITKIEEVYMNSCELETIERGALKKLTKLEVFIAVNNKISELLVGTFDDNVRIQVLNFSQNSIKELNDGLFDKLLDLRILRLESNGIYRIGDKVFNNNLMLTTLKLSHNKLTYVNGNMFEKLNTDLKLYIDHNPWECNCKLWNFYNMTLKFVKHRTYQPQCADKIYLLRKYTWTKLTEREFLCKPTVTFYAIRQPNSKNITLVCKAVANPPPNSLNWYSIENGKKKCISTNMIKSDQKYFTYLNSISIIIPKYINMLYTCIVNQNYLNTPTIIDKNITQEIIEHKLSLQNEAEDQTAEMEIAMLDTSFFEAMKMNEYIIEKRVNVESNAEFNCTDSQNPLWYFRGFLISENVIFHAKDKYEIRQEVSSTILTIRNVSVEDQGLYKCRNSSGNNEEIYFMLSVNELPTVDQSLVPTIVLGAIFFILLISFIITLCYFKRKNHQDIQDLNRAVNRDSTNEYVINKNEYFEESSIYDSSDNNIYEDIIYGPAGK